MADWAGGNKMGKPRAEDLPELFDLMLGTGGRINETLPAQWQDVDMEARPPTITLHRTKAGRDSLTLVLPAFAVAALRRQRARGLPGELIFPSRPLTVRQRSNVGRQLRAAREHVVFDAQGRPDGPRDMFDWVTPHTFRRTVATIVDAEHGADAAAAQLGHSSKAVTEAHYIERRRSAADVTDALDVLAPVRFISDGFSMGEAQGKK